MTEGRYCIGMDVHKDSVQMAVFEQIGEEPICERKQNNGPALLAKEAKRFSQKGETEAAYEAGCLGYVIQRAFEKTRITCYVLPANKMAKKRDGRIKTDKRDTRHGDCGVLPHGGQPGRGATANLRLSAKSRARKRRSCSLIINVCLGCLFVPKGEIRRIEFAGMLRDYCEYSKR